MHREFLEAWVEADDGTHTPHMRQDCHQANAKWSPLRCRKHSERNSHEPGEVAFAPSGVSREQMLMVWMVFQDLIVEIIESPE